MSSLLAWVQKHGRGNNMHNQAGLSLIEILAAILLLSFIFITLFEDLLIRQKLVASLVIDMINNAN